MDNLTHSLVGVLIAKSGLERLSPYATGAAIVAANAPDLDLISIVGGRWAYLEHHRGLSHSIPGVLVISLLIAISCLLIDRWIARREQRAPRVKFAGLAVICLIAGASHPLLDWTNNYGVRPFLPWSNEWYYGDLVFVIDPWLWLILGGAAFLITATTKARIIVWNSLAAALTLALLIALGYSLPAQGVAVETTTYGFWLAGLFLTSIMFRIGVGTRQKNRIAVVALLLVPAYWSGLMYLHSRAIKGSTASALAIASGESVMRVAAMPTIGNPFRWQSLAESEHATYRFVQKLNSPNGEIPPAKRFAKPAPAQANLVDRATKDPNARVFLRFARFPLVRVDGACPEETIVRFADLRYTEPGSSRGPFALDVPVNCAELTGK